ncbi:hypothetical protein B0W47_14585 [Komagataeibacter nataicola]|uniref:Uncharacterized protein n=1 Tax=Komagataeibacter nataicola TaxID=265960 RepID=A0A9N7H1X7_9PROT|nr:hypothetical protein B0W47_14585 [Komagataeibacter nataicola]PYD67178.1 hypothetical protein CDI09_04390 [Komagataeibacter nataicola]
MCQYFIINSIVEIDMVKIGDIFYMDTNKGRAYLQYIKRVKKFGWMIRVFRVFIPKIILMLQKYQNLP